MGSKNDTTKATETKAEKRNDVPAVEQPETTPEAVKEGHEEKVNAVDETRVKIDELTGDNVLEKTIDNPVARSNREVAKQGRHSEVRQDGKGY